MMGQPGSWSVTIFQEDTKGIFDRVGTRCRKPGGDLPKTAKEISKYIILKYTIDAGNADARIVVSDEVCALSRHP
jgi:hypothetical protein